MDQLRPRNPGTSRLELLLSSTEFTNAWGIMPEFIWFASVFGPRFWRFGFVSDNSAKFQGQPCEKR